MKHKRKKIKSLIVRKKKTVFENFYFKNNQHKEFFSQATGKKTALFFINALSLCKYGFITERRFQEKQNARKGFKESFVTKLHNKLRRNPNKFLQIIDKELIDRYKYIGIFIKDLIRIAFISFTLKKLTFLAEYLAFQISKLPKNRKETKFIRFLIRVTKVFASHREEKIALRIRFKGRVNR